MKTIKIYILEHPITKEIRYVGKTLQTLSIRLSMHISEAKSKRYKNHKNSWIQSLLKNNLEPIIVLLDELPNTPEWEWLERYWISQFKSWGFNLTNLTDGGDGNKNQIRSLESIIKFKETIKRKILSGEINYKKRSIKTSKALFGSKHSEITKQKLRDINLGKKQSLESILKRTKGGVLQYKNNKLINKFISLTEASNKTGLNRGNIASVCSGRRKTCGGYTWCYKNKDIVEA